MNVCLYVSADTSQKCVCVSVNAHHKPWEVSSALHAEGTDEEVEDCGDEDYDACHIVQVVQTLMQGGVIQVPTTDDDDQDSSHYLKSQGEGDEGQDGNVVPVSSSLFDDSLHVSDVSQEQSDVQHALSRGLLSGIEVHVQVRGRTTLQRAAGWHGGSQRCQVDVSALLPSLCLPQSLHNEACSEQATKTHSHTHRMLPPQP